MRKKSFKIKQSLWKEKLNALYSKIVTITDYKLGRRMKKSRDLHHV